MLEPCVVLPPVNTMPQLILRMHRHLVSLIQVTVPFLPLERIIFGSPTCLLQHHPCRIRRQ